MQTKIKDDAYHIIFDFSQLLHLAAEGLSDRAGFVLIVMDSARGAKRGREKRQGKVRKLTHLLLYWHLSCMDRHYFFIITTAINILSCDFVHVFELLSFFEAGQRCPAIQSHVLCSASWSAAAGSSNGHRLTTHMHSHTDCMMLFNSLLIELCDTNTFFITHMLK